MGRKETFLLATALHRCSQPKLFQQLLREARCRILSPSPVPPTPICLLAVLQEMLLQSQLTELTERLTLAVCEAERLRTERQELQYQIRHLHDTLAAKLGGSGRQNSSSGGGRAARDSAAEAATAAAVAAAQQEQQQLFMAELQCAQAQIQELQSQNKELRWVGGSALDAFDQVCSGLGWHVGDLKRLQLLQHFSSSRQQQERLKCACEQCAVDLNGSAEIQQSLPTARVSRAPASIPMQASLLAPVLEYKGSSLTR